MDWEISEKVGRGSEENSIISQDRLSDDTDFLIGHNISYNANDSFLDAHSSTTTDLIYDQDLAQNVGSILNQDDRNASTTAYSPGSNSPPKINLQYRYQQGISRDLNRKSGCKSWENNSNWKLSSISNKSDNDSVALDELGTDQTERNASSDRYTGYLSDYDSKVKEGEELIARLLGKANLNEALINSGVDHGKRQERRQDENQWKEPPNLNRSSGNEKSADQSTQNKDNNENNQEIIKNSNVSFVRRWSDCSDTSMHQSFESEKHFERNPSSKRDNNKNSFSLTGDQTDRNRRGRTAVNTQPISYQESMINERNIDAHSIGKQTSNSSSNALVQGDKYKSDGYTENLFISPQAIKRSHPDAEGSPQLKSSYIFGISADNDEQRSSSQISMEDKEIIVNGSLVDMQNGKHRAVCQVRELNRQTNSNFPSEFPEKVSLEKNQIQASTPHKTGWPISPIPDAVDSDESEILIPNKQRKLNAIKLEIEQETTRKEAILLEKLSAEESLLQLKMNIQSLEQLGDEHKKQAIATRYELLEIEQKRSEGQRKLAEITEKINRQKKEFESIPKEQKESNIDEKITLLQDERDDLLKECKILREKCRDSEYLSSTNMDLMKKMRSLQEELYNEQDSSRDKCRSLKEELEKEKKKSVESNIDQYNAVRKLKEEAMDLKNVELNAAIERLEKGKFEEIELQKERHQREVSSLRHRIKELEDDYQKVVESNKDRLNKIHELTENNLRRETEHITKKLKKEQETKLQLCTQRYKRETEELELRLNTKKSEIDTLQAMLRQQEDSTRLLGEKLRSEARDQICMAVEKERSSRLEELQETELELESVKEERAALMLGKNTVLERKEKECERLRNLVNKLKKELEDAKLENYETREEKLQAISKARLDMKEDISKLKTKIRELERVEQTVVLEVNEECLKTTAVTGNSYPSIKRNYELEEVASTCDALNVLKVSNNDLRKQLMAYKKKLDELKVSDESSNQLNRSGDDPTCDKNHTPESLKIVLSGSSEETKSARILKHLQSRVKQLRQGNQSMKKSFGSDEGEADLDATNGSSFFEQAEDASFTPKASIIQNLESAVKRAEEQAHRYANLLSQKMAENTKLHTMLTHASKENIKLERLHAVLQQKMATGAVS